MVKERLTVLFQDLFASKISADCLQEIKLIFDSSSRSQIAATLHDSVGLDVSKFCGFLLTHADDADNGEGICELFEKIIGCLEPMTVVTDLEQVLVIGMEHPNFKIRKAVLRQVERCFQDPSTLAVLSCYPEFLCSVGRRLSDGAPSVAQCSVNSLQLLGKDPETFHQLFKSPLKEVLAQMLTRDATVRFRLYNVMVGIATERATALPLIAEEYSEPLLSELDSGDVLLQLNCLQQLGELASSQHGLLFLQKKGLLDRLDSLLATSAEDTLASFLVPGILKFFGSVGRLRPEEVFENHTSVVHFIMSAIEGGDPSLLAVSVETLGVLGSSQQGKRLLQRTGDSLESCLRSVGSLLQGGSTEELKIRVLGMLTQILQLLPTGSEEPEVLSAVTESWFLFLGPDPTQMILSLAKQPFPELHCAALGLIKSLVSWHWGQLFLQRQGGFLEYLLDRSTEHEKEGKEIKYSIVQILVESRTSGQVFGEEVMTQLRQFLREGPFFVRAETVVALESAS